MITPPSPSMPASPAIPTPSAIPTPTATSHSERLPGLEALRCVAAVCVLLLHTRAVYGGIRVFGRGYLGVDFFLMLSGFLMARVQEPRLAASEDGWGLRSGGRFLAQRYRRLWPLMALGGVIGLPMQLVRSHAWPAFLRVSALNLALLPAPDQYFAFPLNIPAWTIFAEVCANTIHVLLLRRLRGVWLSVVLLVLLGAVVGIALRHGSLDVGATSGSLLAGLTRCLFAYTLGIGLARAWRHRAPPPVPPLIAFALMPALIAASWWLKVTGPWFDLGFVLLVCPLMLAGGVRLRWGKRLAGLAGSLAFPLFAWQMPILQGMQHLGFTYWDGLAGALAGGVIGVFVATWIDGWRQKGSKR